MLKWYWNEIEITEIKQKYMLEEFLRHYILLKLYEIQWNYLV